MKIADLCNYYFSGIQNIQNYKNQDKMTTLLVAGIVLTYLTLVIPLGVAAIRRLDFLYDRVTQTKDLSSQDEKVKIKAKKIFNNPPVIAVDIRALQEKAIPFVKEWEYSDKILDYINKVLANPTFKENPRLFMDKWIAKKSPQWKYVESPAIIFFEEELGIR